MSELDYGKVSPVSAGLRSRCPRCGQGHLFRGFLSVAHECDACGLSFAEVDSGDGPAVFVILIAGFIVVAAALVVEVRYQPSYWLHAVLWLPLVLVLTLGLLRPFKATLIALQYKHAAREGRRKD